MDLSSGPSTSSLPPSPPGSVPVPIATTGPTKKRRRLTNRRRPRSDRKNLEAIHIAIKDNGWTMKHLLEAYEKEQGKKEYRTFWLQFKRFAYGRPHLEKSDWDRMFSLHGIDYVVHHFRKEMKRPGKTSSLGTFQHADATNHLNLGSLESRDTRISDINSYAPGLKRFLCLLGSPAHNQNADAPELGPLQTVWISMLLCSMQRKNCNNLPILIGIYLVNSGVQKRIVDTMSSIGLCASYSTIQDVLKIFANVG